ncbi:MAG: hypothetical protein QOF53_662 [Nocardioidaceae bacterium]|nr:hypothetical protein [Nocardioidaceae bacterium]
MSALLAERQFDDRSQANVAARSGPRWLVPVVAITVVLVRLPFLGAPLGLDESGYLTVAHQWHPGGTSLYGDLWVDRPPLLLMIYQLADALGGGVALRVIGIGAAVAVTLLVQRAAARLAGSRAGVFAALLAGALLVSPLAGGEEVNGELLAAPFVAAAVVCLVEALRADARRVVIWAGLAGATGAAAVLVKQNMLDVAVLSCALLLPLSGGIGRRKVAPLALGLAVGGVVSTVVVATWTVAHGTSLSGVFYAMYPFRLEAARVLAATPDPAAQRRGLHLGVAALQSGLAIVVAWLVVALLREVVHARRQRRDLGLRHRVLIALAITIGYDVLSICSGGSYWSHYLIQLVVPVAVAGGLTLSRWPSRGRLLVAFTVASAAISVITGITHPPGPHGQTLGAAIGAASHPRDTIITIWGHSDVTHASGLRTPYPYLWSLPTQTLDPDLRLLTATLDSPRRPTWFVAWSAVTHPGLDTSRLSAALRENYDEVEVSRGSTVFLRQGVKRPVPAAGGRPS